MNRLQSHLRRHFKQGIKFVVCGILGALMEFSILYVLVGRMHITPFVAYVFSGGIPAFFVFLFNRNVTFRVTEGNAKRQSRRFILVYTLTFLLNYVLSISFYSLGVAFVLPLSFAQTYGLTSTDITFIAKVFAIGVTAVVNYTFSHLFIFKKEPIPIETQLAVF